MSRIHRSLPWLVVSILVWGAWESHGETGSPDLSAGAEVAIQVAGKTQPAVGRAASIAPMMLHPVTKVLVAPGDRVRTGQALVELDADEPAAVVRGHRATLAELQASLARLQAEPREHQQAEARAALSNAQISRRAAQEYHDRMESLKGHDAVSTRQYIEAHVAMLRAEADERAAQARLDCLMHRPIAHEIAEVEARVAVARAELDAAEAELEHYTLHAPIDGIVAWLSVLPGAVARPGMVEWGQIVDVRQLDVRCELTAEQLGCIDARQAVDVSLADRPALRFTGRVVQVGLLADPKTGLVPVLVRIENDREALRVNIGVVATFRSAAGEVVPQITRGDERRG